ncbi:hypothetical protein BHM03_00030390, partial [Ensete ventricosum]
AATHDQATCKGNRQRPGVLQGGRTRPGSPTRAARPQGAAAHGQGYRLQGRLLVGTTASSGSARRGGACGNGTGPQERSLEGRGCRLHRSDDNGLLEVGRKG